MSTTFKLPDFGYPKVLSRRQHKSYLIKMINAHYHNAFSGMEHDNKAQKLRRRFFNARQKSHEIFSFLMALVVSHLMIMTMVFVFGSEYYFKLSLIYGNLFFAMLELNAGWQLLRQSRIQRDQLLQVLKRRKILSREDIDYTSYRETVFREYFSQMSPLSLATFVDKYSHRAVGNVLLAFEVSRRLKELKIVSDDSEDFDLYLGSLNDFRPIYALNKGAFWEISYNTLLKYLRSRFDEKDFLPILKHKGEEKILETLLLADQKDGFAPMDLQQLTELLTYAKAQLALVSDGNGLFADDMESVMGLNASIEALSQIVTRYVDHGLKMQKALEAEQESKRRDQEKAIQEAAIEFQKRLEKNITNASSILQQAQSVLEKSPVHFVKKQEVKRPSVILKPTKKFMSAPAKDDIKKPNIIVSGTHQPTFWSTAQKMPASAVVREADEKPLEQLIHLTVKRHNASEGQVPSERMDGVLKMDLTPPQDKIVIASAIPVATEATGVSENVLESAVVEVANDDQELEVLKHRTSRTHTLKRRPLRVSSPDFDAMSEGATLSLPFNNKPSTA